VPNGSGTTCEIWGVQSGDFGADRSGGAPIAALYALRGVTGNKPPDSALDIRDMLDRKRVFAVIWALSADVVRGKNLNKLLSQKNSSLEQRDQ
jgi:hypothetical protein